MKNKSTSLTIKLKEDKLATTAIPSVMEDSGLDIKDVSNPRKDVSDDSPNGIAKPFEADLSEKEDKNSDTTGQSGANKESISSYTVPTDKPESGITPTLALPGLQSIDHLEKPSLTDSKNGEVLLSPKEKKQSDGVKAEVKQIQKAPETERRDEHFDSQSPVTAENCLPSSKISAQLQQMSDAGGCDMKPALLSQTQDANVADISNPDGQKPQDLLRTLNSSSGVTHGAGRVDVRPGSATHCKANVQRQTKDADSSTNTALTDRNNIQDPGSSQNAKAERGTRTAEEAETDKPSVWPGEQDMRWLHLMENAETSVPVSRRCNNPDYLRERALLDQGFRGCRGPDKYDWTKPEPSSDWLNTLDMSEAYCENTWPCSNGCGNEIPFGDGSMMCSECHEDFLRNTTLLEYEAAEPPAKPSVVCQQDSVDNAEPTFLEENKDHQIASFYTDTANVTEYHDNVPLRATQQARSSPVPISSKNRVKKSKTLCALCHKKLPLIEIECRCGGLFCIEHRLSEVHKCKFDFKTFGRQRLMEENVRVIAEKIAKI